MVASSCLGSHYFTLHGYPRQTRKRLISIHDARSVTRDQVVDLLRPCPQDITEHPLPEISPSSRSRIFVVEYDLVPLNPGEKPIRLQKVFRLQPVRWEPYQPGIFTFAFVQMQDAAAVCVMELWETLIIAVSAPWPGMQGPFRKCRKNLFSRGQQ